MIMGDECCPKSRNLVVVQTDKIHANRAPREAAQENRVGVTTKLLNDSGHVQLGEWRLEANELDRAMAEPCNSSNRLSVRVNPL